jgi:two-component system response regulator DegU
MKEKLIRVSIADDHDIIRQGIKRIISFQKDLSIVSESENGERALSMLKLYETDVLLLDFNMPLLNGIEVLKIIKQQENNLKVIMLTVENDRKTLHEAIDIGADGYLLKDSAGTEIVNAIKTVFNGEKYIDKSLVSLLFSGIKSSNKIETSILDCLSKREVEVLMEISKGLGNKEIGNVLYLSEKTVKNYATSMFRKINVDDRVQAAILAINNNIVDYYKSKTK